MAKVYGCDKTELVLTEKAKRGYEAIMPIEIREYYLPGRIVSQRYVKGRMAYDITGAWEGKQLTAAGVIDFLEQIADDEEGGEE